MGGAFLAAALPARIGRRAGLPTIPLFMLAGILLGPNTPGISLGADPHDFAMLSALGRVLLLFYLGLEFHLDDLQAGGRRMLTTGAVYLVMNVLAGVLASRLNGMGRIEASAIGLTLLSRGEFALVLGAMAAAAGLDSRLGPFIAGYVLVLALLGPLAASQSDRFAKLLPGGDQEKPAAAGV